MPGIFIKCFYECRNRIFTPPLPHDKVKFCQYFIYILIGFVQINSLSADVGDLAARSYVDGAVAAITESLAAVATSGSYNDLTDKPSNLLTTSQLYNSIGANTDGAMTQLAATKLIYRVQDFMGNGPETSADIQIGGTVNGDFFVAGTAIGSGSIVSGGDFGVAVGSYARVDKGGGVAVGGYSQANGTEGVAIGEYAVVNNSSYGIAIGSGSSASSVYSVALGANAGVMQNSAKSIAIGNESYAFYPNSIALGASSATIRANTVAVGDENFELYRAITAVADPINDHDAVNKQTMDGAINSAMGAYIPKPSGACSNCVLHYDGTSFSWMAVIDAYSAP
ncbi:MAG: hypothetical protein LBO08_01240 [Rickettsiales bacterium]|jgi:hypothetical protein|nr:hypothetical protein [Rickettsiales bacterium]